jgi:hypothetical protein
MMPGSTRGWVASKRLPQPRALADQSMADQRALKHMERKQGPAAPRPTWSTVDEHETKRHRELEEKERKRKAPGLNWQTVDEKSTEGFWLRAEKELKRQRCLSARLDSVPDKKDDDRRGYVVGSQSAREV